MDETCPVSTGGRGGGGGGGGNLFPPHWFDAICPLLAVLAAERAVRAAAQGARAVEEARAVNARLERRCEELNQALVEALSDRAAVLTPPPSY